VRETLGVLNRQALNWRQRRSARTKTEREQEFYNSRRICMYIYIYISIYIHIYTSICSFMCLHARIHAHICASTHARTVAIAGALDATLAAHAAVSKRACGTARSTHALVNELARLAAQRLDSSERVQQMRREAHR
jgi:hypothetical protein